MRSWNIHLSWLIECVFAMFTKFILFLSLYAVPCIFRVYIYILYLESIYLEFGYLHQHPWRLKPCSICFWFAVDTIVWRCETFCQIKLLSLHLQPVCCDEDEDGGHSQVQPQPWCCFGSPCWTHATGPSSLPGQLLVVSRGWSAPSREEGDEQVPGSKRNTVRCRPSRGRRVSGCD